MPHLPVHLYLALACAGPATEVLSLSCVEACIVLVVLGDENVEMAAGLSLSKVEGGLVYNYKPIQPWLGVYRVQDSNGGFRGAGTGCVQVSQVSPLTHHYSSSPMHGTQ